MIEITDLHEPILRWYETNARDLPWRSGDATAWGVLVSEVMLQQTPVARVLPVWTAWMSAWPTPADLAAVSPGEAVRAWGRLGYPRRALRLHAAAAVITDRHAGTVPDDLDALLALPGVGGYTAAAVAAFAFGRRQAVLDTNVRRVLARAVRGAALPSPTLTADETRLAVALLPVDAGGEPPVSPRWNVALMELGALVCTARAPACDRCPVSDLCRWHLAGRPAHDGPARRAQPWEGTDRQVRGRLLSVLRATTGEVSATDLEAAWDDAEQRQRCLRSLIADGLIENSPGRRFRLPS